MYEFALVRTASFRVALAAFASIGTLLASASVADGTFPGANGKLALDSYQLQSRISTVNPNGSGLAQLTSGFSADGTAFDEAGAPAWSPDGKRIAFGSFDRRSAARLEVMDADGTNRTTLFENTTGLGNPAWSPDGKELVFTTASGLYVIDANGGTPVPIRLSGDVPDSVVRSPDWSPDGTKIAFQGANYEEFCDLDECYIALGPPDIYVVNPDGSDSTALTSFCIGVECGDSELPSWSPNGSKIAFSHGGVIYTMDASGGSDSRLDEVGTAPVWSPDGLRIAFTTDQFQDSNSIYIMDADGANPTKILDGGSGILEPTYTTSSWQPIPNLPPDCSGVTATPDELWPPNKKLLPVALGGATDPEGDAVTLEVTGVTQDEPVGGSADASPTSGATVQLRAERDPGGDGRVYEVHLTATDSKGARCGGSLSIGVPRHQNRAPVSSAPPSFDSFGP